MHALSTATACNRVMRVTYHPAFSIVAPAGSADTIDILVPGSQGSVHASFRTRDGRAANALAEHLRDSYARAEAPLHVGLAPNRLRRVLAIVEERLGTPLPVGELAAEVHLSVFHFVRMFREAIGQPPHAYITQRRMERAKTLLAASSLSLADVAASVGYQTQAHFT